MLPWAFNVKGISRLLLLADGTLTVVTICLLWTGLAPLATFSSLLVPILFAISSGLLVEIPGNLIIRVSIR